MKKSMWIWIAVAVSVLLLLILVFAISQPTPKTMVGICYRNDATDMDKDLRSSLEQRLTAQGYQAVVIDADGDQAKQLDLVKELKNRGCKALVVEPVMTAAAGELLDTLNGTGLPSVLFNRPIDTELLKKYPNITYVGVDNTMPGKLQAEMLPMLSDGGDLNGDGIVSYLVLQGPEDHIDTAVGVKTLEESLQAIQSERECIALCYGDGTRESGQKLCKQYLASYGKDIEVIICGSDAIAQGALDAIDDGGRTVGKDVYLLAAGQDKTPADQGRYTGMAYLDPFLQYQTAANHVLGLLQGQTPAQITILPYVSVISGKNPS